MKILKIVLLVLLLLAGADLLLACPVCEKNQPALLKGISHGVGPESQWDLWIIGVAGVLVIITLLLSLKYLLNPQEGAPDHIKNSILSQSR